MQILRFVDNIKINIKYLKVIYLNIIPQVNGDSENQL